MSPSKRTVEWVSKSIIRQIFNENQIYEKVLTGEYQTILKKNSHPDLAQRGEPYCTHSQIVYYYDQSRKPVAIVHQYMRPDGTLGAKGKPDPKWLYIEGRILSTKTTRN